MLARSVDDTLSPFVGRRAIHLWNSFIHEAQIQAEFRWSARRARAVVRDGVRRGFLRFQGERLVLTDTGRAEAAVPGPGALMTVSKE